MNKLEKDALYKKILKAWELKPRSARVHGQLRDNYPALFTQLKDKFEVEHLGWEHLFRFCYPAVKGKCGTCG